MKILSRSGVVAFMAMVMGVNALPIRAETLNAALVEAYRHNPTLNAARAGQRATDESVPQALAGWRPTLGATGTYALSDTYSTYPASPDTYFQPTQPGVNIKLDQPIFRGLKTVEGTAAAEAQVRAGRQQLIGTEQATLFNAAKAFLDLQRDRQILAFRQQDLEVLRGLRRGTSERFKVGQLTRIDVAQADASVASAEAQMVQAVAAVRADEASYIQYIGHEATSLEGATVLAAPESLEVALRDAGKVNPSILAAVETAEANDHKVGVARSGLLPQADLIAAYGNNQQYNGPVNQPVTTSAFSVTGQVTVPLYEGGVVYSQVRQAKETANQSRISVIDATRTARQGVIAAWSNLLAAKQATTSNRANVTASRLAYVGTREAYKVGSKSTLDVLNAELALLTAEISAASSEHDMVLASYQLQAAIGRLTGENLRLGPAYDSKGNYDRVHYKFIGTDADLLPIK